MKPTTYKLATLYARKGKGKLAKAVIALDDAIHGNPTIKLRCGVCHNRPDDFQDVLHINAYEMCRDCINYDANYEGAAIE